MTGISIRTIALSPLQCPHAHCPPPWWVDIVFVYSLQDTGAVDPTSQYIRKVWACPSCQSKIAVTLAEQLQHQAQCKAAVEGSRKWLRLFLYWHLSYTCKYSERRFAGTGSRGGQAGLLLFCVRKGPKANVDRDPQAQACTRSDKRGLNYGGGP